MTYKTHECCICKIVLVFLSQENGLLTYMQTGNRVSDLWKFKDLILKHSLVRVKKRNISTLNLDRNQMARTDDKTSPEREKPDKKHLKAVDRLPSFPCDQGNGGSF